jgi:primosomal replication protein N
MSSENRWITTRLRTGLSHNRFNILAQQFVLVQCSWSAEIRAEQVRDLLRSIVEACYLQVVPLIANEAGTALVVLFQVPLNPMPL